MTPRPAYLLTWNPKRWAWAPARALAELAASGATKIRWSCGRTRRIEVGDRLFLLRQGGPPRGIIASGVACSRPRAGRHWDATRTGTTNYLWCRLDALVDPDGHGLLQLARLTTRALARVNWRTQSSGISIPTDAAAQLERRWLAHLAIAGLFPARASLSVDDAVTARLLYSEGADSKSIVNRYERDLRARSACIRHHGYSCVACGFDFAATYGRLGKGFIHVHHLVPLASVGRAYKVDPIRDMRPVCANCHSMLHRGGTLRSVDELRLLLRAKARGGRTRGESPPPTHAPAHTSGSAR